MIRLLATYQNLMPVGLERKKKNVHGKFLSHSLVSVLLSDIPTAYTIGILNTVWEHVVMVVVWGPG